MNNEINNIFEELMRVTNGTQNYCSFYRNESNLLLHYYKDLNNKIYDLQEENTDLKQEMIIFRKITDDYKSRNEKAIEYIKFTTCYGMRSDKTLLHKYLKDLLNILEGSDKE